MSICLSSVKKKENPSEPEPEKEKTEEKKEENGDKDKVGNLHWKFSTCCVYMHLKGFSTHLMAPKVWNYSQFYKKNDLIPVSFFSTSELL